MREIKFRYTFQHGETGRIASTIRDLEDEGPYLDFPSHKWTLIGRDQYIGRKDKNGKEIYEGHIVKDINKIGIWKVIYFAPGFELRCLSDIPPACQIKGQYRKSLKGASGRLSRGAELEIIGTIYENPSLLKKATHEKAPV